MAESNGNHPVVGAPTVSYQAVAMYAANKRYGEQVGDIIRGIKSMTPEQLNEAGILRDGKLDGERVWSYINRAIKPVIRNQFGDPNDFNYLPQFPQVKNVVTQLGKKGVSTDLIEALVGMYSTIATNYVGQKDQQMVAAMPTEDGKKTARVIAGLTGNMPAYDNWIDGAKDPTEVAQIKGQLDGELNQKVIRADQTGTLEDLLRKAA